MLERKLLQAYLSPRSMVYTLVLPIKSSYGVYKHASIMFIFVAEMYAELDLSQVLIS